MDRAENFGSQSDTLDHAKDGVALSELEQSLAGVAISSDRFGKEDTQTFNNNSNNSESSVSSTFHTMFPNDERNVAAMIDGTPDHIVQDVLSFVYRGYINTNLDIVSREDEDQLIYAARKYKISGLLALLLMSINEKLSPTNACRYLLLADFYSINDLKASCFAVITQSAESRTTAVNTPEWDLVCANMELLKDFLLFHPN